MSEEFVCECLKHKDNRHIQTRLDYLFLFRNETKAKVIRIMETWTTQKRAEWYKATLDSKEQGREPPEEELWVTMSYEQFSLFAFETIKHDTIKEAVDDLVESEYLGRRPHPEFPYGPPQYLLNLGKLQHLLNIQEIPVLDGRGIIIPPRKKHTPQEKYPQGRGKDHRGDPGKIPPPRGENTPPSNNTTKNLLESSKNEGTYGAHAPTPAHLLKEVNEKLEEVEEELEHITGEHPAVHIDTESHYHIAGVAIGNEEEPVLTVPRLILPAKDKIGANTHGRKHDTSGVNRRNSLDRDSRDTSTPLGDSHRIEDARTHAGTGRDDIADSAPEQVSADERRGSTQEITSQQAPGALTGVQAQPLSAPTPAQADFPPAGSVARPQAPTAQASGFTPPKRPTLKSDPREVQKRIDANRGYALEEKVEVIRERQAIKTWCSLHEIGECDLVLDYLTTQDKYWKLEENKHRIGGVNLAKETPKVLAALERKGQPAQGPPQDWVPAENDYSTKAQLWRQEHPMARSGK